MTEPKLKVTVGGYYKTKGGEDAHATFRMAPEGCYLTIDGLILKDSVACQEAWTEEGKSYGDDNDSLDLSTYQPTPFKDETNEMAINKKLKECPFCGEKVKIGVHATELEIACCVSMCLEIHDVLYDLGMTRKYPWNPLTNRYPEEAVELARKSLTECWNTRKGGSYE